MLRPIPPVYVLIRFVDYDAENDIVLPRSQNSPLQTISINGMVCFPIFTSIQAAERLRNKAGTKDVVVQCDIKRIRKILDELKPPGVVFNPTGEWGEEFKYLPLEDYLHQLIDPV